MLVRADQVITTQEGTMLAGVYAMYKNLEPVITNSVEIRFDGRFPVYIATNKKIPTGTTFMTCEGRGTLTLNKNTLIFMTAYTWFGVKTDMGHRIVVPKNAKSFSDVLKNTIEKLSGSEPIIYDKDAYIFVVDELLDTINQLGLRTFRVPSVVYSLVIEDVAYFVAPLLLTWEESIRGARVNLKGEFAEQIRYLLASRLNVFMEELGDGYLIKRPEVDYIKNQLGMTAIGMPRQSLQVSAVIRYTTNETYYDIPTSCVDGIKLEI